MLEMIIYFVLGSCIGSFLNVCIYRWPRCESIVWPRSFCPECNQSIPWQYLVPLFSFLWLKGKCKDCGKGISWRYFGIELLTGMIFVYVGTLEILLSHKILYLILICCLLIVIVTDWLYYIIPDEVIYVLLVVGIFFVCYIQGDWWRHFLGALYSFLVMGGLFLLTKGGMGGGDVKLSMALGLWLGDMYLFMALLITFVSGAIAGLVYILVGSKDKQSIIAFGPFICLGYFSALVWGEKFLKLLFGF